MINPFLIGIPTWLLSCLIAYVVRESSLRGLDAQQAGTLVLGLRPIRLRTTIAMVGVVALVLLIRFSSPNLAKSVWMAPCFPLVASVLVVAQIAAMKTLKRAPPTHIPSPLSDGAVLRLSGLRLAVGGNDAGHHGVQRPQVISNFKKKPSKLLTDPREAPWKERAILHSVQALRSLIKRS